MGDARDGSDMPVSTKRKSRAPGPVLNGLMFAGCALLLIVSVPSMMSENVELAVGCLAVLLGLAASSVWFGVVAGATLFVCLGHDKLRIPRGRALAAWLVIPLLFVGTICTMYAGVPQRIAFSRSRDAFDAALARHRSGTTPSPGRYGLFTVARVTETPDELRFTLSSPSTSMLHGISYLRHGDVENMLWTSRLGGGWHVWSRSR